MTASKTTVQSESEESRFRDLSVYELANAAAKEAKRINDRFSAAKQMPPENPVRTALKRATGGQVTYRMEEESTDNGGEEPGG